MGTTWGNHSQHYFKTSPIDLNVVEDRIFRIAVNTTKCPHIYVNILGITCEALLDSGAAISVISSLDLINMLGLIIFPTNMKISTADKTAHECVGYSNIPYTFDSVTHIVPTVIVPEICKYLILGIDFWNIFHIEPALRKANNSFTPISLVDGKTAQILNFELIPGDQKSREVAEVEDISLELPTYDIPTDAVVKVETLQTEHDLSLNQKQQLVDIINSFPNTSNGKIGRTTLTEHEIRLKPNAVPKRLPMIKMSPKVEEEVEKEINRMIKLDVIEPCKFSRWLNNIVPVRKPSGQYRICLDFRKLNEMSEKDYYPFPGLHSVLERLGSAKYFSVIDLSDAFWQVPLNQESRDKTAFRTARGLYQFKVMPFGLHGSPATLNRLMRIALGNDLEPWVSTYLDDVIIAAKTLEEHFRLLKLVSDRLRAACLTISITKSKFCQKKVNYVGYILCEEGICVDADKIAPILNYESPKNIKGVRRLLGMGAFYQRFIKAYSDMVAPISDTLKKNKGRFVWTEEAEWALRKLKEVLTSPPVLVNPNFSKEFIIETDSSDKAVGAVLMQKDENDRSRPVCYFSRKLSATQKNYCATERECLAVLLAVEHFRHFIDGTHFKIITDAESLKWLMQFSGKSAKLLRWSLKLQEFDFCLEYRKGTLNTTADALSRSISTIRLHNVDNSYELLKSEISTDPENYKEYTVNGDRIYKYVKEETRFTDGRYKWKYLPREHEKAEIIKKAHDENAHLGYDKTADRIRERYWWPRMSGEIKLYCKNCLECKKNKTDNTVKRPPMGEKHKVASQPWQFISMDYIGPFPRSKQGNTCLLVIVDWFSKFVLIEPMRAMKASTLCKFVEENVFKMFSVPEIVLSDNGTQFLSREFKKLLDKYQVKHFLTAKYFPQANPTERVNRTIVSAIRSSLKGKTNQKEWDEDSQLIANAIRTATHASTGYTPFYLNFGRNYIATGEEYGFLRDTNDPSTMNTNYQQADLYKNVQDNIKKAYDNYSKNYNLRSNKAVTFEEGSHVLRENKVQSDKDKGFNAKLANKYVEAIVKRKLGSNCYELLDLNGKNVGVYHGSMLKRKN